MDTHSNVQRLTDAGFTDRQARAILDAIEQSTGQLVTRDYLDLRLREEFQRYKRSMLLWMLAMQAPTYAALIYVILKIGG
jgi:hypothetical protein